MAICNNCFASIGEDESLMESHIEWHKSLLKIIKSKETQQFGKMYIDAQKNLESGLPQAKPLPADHPYWNKDNYYIIPNGKGGMMFNPKHFPGAEEFIEEFNNG